MTDDQRPGAELSAVRRVTVSIVSNFLFYCLGLYTLLPVLPVLIPKLHAGTGLLMIGLTLGAFNFAVRGSSVFVGGYLHRNPVRSVMITGLLTAAAGYVLVAYSPSATTMLLALILAGVGTSTNGLAARVYISMTVSGATERNNVFSAMQVAVNLAAALGPIIGDFLFGRGLVRPMMIGIAASYCVAALVVRATVPRGLRPDADSARAPLRFGLLRVIVADRPVRRVSIVAAVGGLLYAQFFSAVALQVARLTTSPSLRASVFTANAIIIVAAQVPISAAVKRRLLAGISPLTLLAAGMALYVLSFAVMGGLGLHIYGVYLATVLFSLAETLFTPLVNTAFAELDGDRPLVEVFNLRQVAVTVGESSGSFLGGALYLTAAERGETAGYWLALAAVGAVVAVPHLWSGRRPISAQPAQEVSTELENRKVSR